MTPALAKKITTLAATCRRNGYTQPVTVELTVREVRELAELAEQKTADKPAV